MKNLKLKVFQSSRLTKLMEPLKKALIYHKNILMEVFF